MANSTNSPEKSTTDPTPPPDNPNRSKSDLPDSSSSAIPLNPNPNPNNLQPTAIAPPPQIQPFVPSSQPPGVMMQPPQYGQPGQQPMRMYAPMPNGYQMSVPQGTMNPPGIIRYGAPYPQMLRPVYPQRPLGAMGVVPTLSRPPMMAMRGPVVPTIVRPPINLNISQAEKPMTTIYVGKIASTVDNDFMLSLLQLCGPVKSWKRVPDPTTGALKGFGFCEFESVEGVLRALRLLSKLSIDGQELMINFDKPTKAYLKSYVEKKKKDDSKNTEGADKQDENASVEESKDVSKEDKKEDDKDKEANIEIDDYSTFGLVTNEDKEADKGANEKLKGMIEERIKNKPLPPPPPPPQMTPDVIRISTSEHPAKSVDGDSDADVTRNLEDKNDEEMTSKSIPSSENEKPETSSPDRNIKTDRRSKDRERDLKREKERELERYEREREQERAKREREREYKIREDERRYRARLKEWESREKEKERARKQEREREKEREQDRKYEILDQEDDDGYSKKRKYRSSGEEREEIKRRLREKEEDMEDKIKEEEEIAEAKRKAEEEKEMQIEQQKHALELLANNNTVNGSENAMLIDGSSLDIKNKAADHQNTDVEMKHAIEIGNQITQNGSDDDSVMAAASDTKHSNTTQTKKLGFGLVGSGKRTTVPSLFHEEEDEDAQKDKKMRPLVPIDYSTEELQAVRETTPVAPLAAAAEFAKRIGHANSKEEKPDSDRERSKRDRSGHRDRDRNYEDSNKSREKEHDKGKTPDNKKLLDAKQLIDTIPKTKDELFSYPINWAIYDKNGLHERMRPWISKKITEFLGEEEATLVDYIVSSTQEHVTADEMLERLQSILDDEAEMFVLKVWRMLIFEIKKVETGLTGKPKA
ncbi:RNA-binding motif protein 25-like isoform X2 [Rutidosis leptorrhynchoides]|uniref:RNA-binding motif protein 25-like isoform X2 n=1 Tax=Rutidosis leptorrhynchoides TaxID=125765 RepID=UPI003A99D50C